MKKKKKQVVFDIVEVDLDLEAYTIYKKVAFMYGLTVETLASAVATLKVMSLSKESGKRRAE